MVARPVSATATYVYCAVHHPRRPSLAGAPSGLPDAGPPRLLDAGMGLWLVVATVPLRRYRGEAIDDGLGDLEWVSRRAVAHAAVVEHVARAATVIPMKLFTIFTADARALAHVARLRPRLERLVRRLAGRREWGVRVSFDPARAARKARARPAPRAGAGTAFLLAKRRERDLARRLTGRSRAGAARVFRELARLADGAVRRPLPAGAGGRVVLDGAFLVTMDAAQRFRSAARRLAARIRDEGYELTLTGPWPPYNFVGSAR
jgi:hypothetical protein